MSVIDQKKLEFDHNESSEKSSTSSKNNVDDIHLSQKKRVIFWLYIVLLTLYFAGMIALTITQWNPMQAHKTSDNYYYANQVAYQWTLGYIQDIQITSSSNCPNGYQSAVNFTWAGTGYGCYCSSGQNVSFVLQGYCSASLIQQNCANMASKQPIKANRWKNVSNICFKRSTHSFANQNRYDNSGTNKLCGLSSSTVIMPLSQPCPYVNISYANFTLENNTLIISDLQHKLSPLYAIYNSTSPYSFYSYPIIKFKVSEYEFCLMDEDNGLDPDHSDFLLLSQQRSCQQVGNYTTLDSLNEIDFYANNAELNNLQNSVGFPNPSNWQYKLGFANLPSWTYPCRHNYDGKFNVQNSINQFNYAFYDSYKVSVIFLAIFISGIGVEVFVIVLRRIFNSSIYPVGYKQRFLPVDFCKAITRYILDAICKIVIAIISFYLTWRCFYNWNWFKGVNNFNCFANNPQIKTQIIQPYTTLYLNSFTLSTAISVLTVVMIIIDIIHFIYIWKHQLNFYLVESQDKMMIKNTQEEDLKWMEEKSKDILIQNIENQNRNDDQFKITMAQNMFAMDDDQPERVKKIVKKKKKKRGLPFRKKDQADNNNNDPDSPNQRSPEISGSFNPYQLEDNTLFNIDSIMTSKKEQQSPTRKRRK